MMNRIIDFSDKNRFLIFLFVLVAIVLGWNAMKNTKLDAIPDLSDTQVIVYAKWDRSPDIMEDQVSYPITSALLGLPKVKDIRAFSDFGYSYIYIIFDEGTDLYWARSRTLEYLNSVTPKLPKGVSVELAKDVTSVGWVYQNALVDINGKIQHRPTAFHFRTGTCATHCKRCRVLPPEVAPKRRIRAAVPSECRSQQVAGIQDPHQRGERRSGQIEQRRGRKARRVHRARVHGARPRLRPLARRHRQDRNHGQRADGNAGAGPRRRYGYLRSRHAQRRRRTGWQGRSGGWRCHYALWRKCAEGDRTHQGKAQRFEVHFAAGRQIGDDLRPVRLDRSRSR